MSREPETRPGPGGRLGQRPSLRKATEVFQSRNFRLLWASSSFAFTGMGMQQITRALLAWQLTESFGAVGAVSLSFGLPMLLLALIGGSLADRFEKRNLSLITQVATGILALITAILVMTDTITFELLIAVGLVQGTFFAIGMPARTPLMAEAVGPERVMSAIAMSQASMNATRLVGPALAGAVVATSGIDIAYFVQAGLYGVAVIFLLMVPTGIGAATREKAAATRRNMFVEIGRGLRYVATDSQLRLLIGMMFIMTFFAMPYIMLLAGFVQEDLGQGQEAFGWLQSISGVGALAGSLGVATITGFDRKPLLQWISGLLVGGGLLLLAVGSAEFGFIGAIVAVVVLGLAFTTYQTLNNTMSMGRALPEYYGRVQSINMLTFSSMPLMAYPLGELADRIGARQTFLAQGIVVLGCMALVAIFNLRYTFGRDKHEEAVDQTSSVRPAIPGTPLLERWASFAYRRRWGVLVAWVVGLAALIGTTVTYGGAFVDTFELPGTESQAAFDLLEENFSSQAGAPANVVFRAEAGIADPGISSRIAKTLASIEALEPVIWVESPLQISPYVSADGTIARAVVQFQDVPGDIALSDLDAVYAIIDAANSPGLKVEIGGAVVSSTEGGGSGSEAIGMLAAVVILLLAFGSIVAAGLPISGAVFGLGTGFGIVALAANLMTFPSFAPQFASMIGIGVGIDYALLVVTRFREGLHTGNSVERSVVTAVATAGRSVIFAGVVVAVSFLGLAFMGIPFVTAMGITGAVVVGTSVLVALTLMPALLGFAGHRIDRWHIPFLKSREGVDEQSIWFRLSRSIQRRPLPYFLATMVFLIALGAPVLDIRLGFTDEGNRTEDFRSRRAYDLLAEGFGPGFNGVVLLVVDGPDTPTSSLRMMKAVSKHPNIEGVFPPRMNPGGTTAVITAVPKTSPQDPATAELVKDLRADVLPPFTGAETQAYVTGGVAVITDIGNRISVRLPYLFAGVIGISFLLLMAVFRSALVALKAAILNLLSISAAFGVLVAIFQWGWGAELIGVKEGPIETFAPMMLFAILFGLSMDYEVFLISRIREEYLHTGNNATAVSNGLTATARVITTAAAIMVTLFLSFVLGDDRVIKEFGIGLATAIFVDATIVRLILVPATMELLGDANWWLPGWLNRLLPEINLEGGDAPKTPADEAAAGG